MSETSSISFVLNASGYPASIPNTTYQQSGNLTVNYTIAGLPATMRIVIEGLSNPSTSNTDWGHQAGSPTVLDTYSSTGSVSNRSVALSALYDSFRVTATWTGGTNVLVNGNITASGSGPTFSSTNLPAQQVYDA